MSDHLRSIFTRWLALERNKADISDEAKDLFAEAKGNGYEPKALRAAFRQIVKDEEAEADPEKAELQAMINLYVDALKFGAAVEPSRVSAPARVEIINEISPESGKAPRGLTSDHDRGNPGGSHDTGRVNPPSHTSGESRERQRTGTGREPPGPAKPEAPPMDDARKGPSGTAATDDDSWQMQEDIPANLRRSA